MDLTRADKDQLLRWALKRIETNADELQSSYFNHFTKRVEGIHIRHEIAESRRWVQRARELLNVEPTHTRRIR